MRLYPEWMRDEEEAAAKAVLAEGELKSGLDAHMAATGDLPAVGNSGGWVDYEPQGESPPAEVQADLKSAATSPVVCPDSGVLEPVLEFVGPGLLTEEGFSAKSVIPRQLIDDNTPIARVSVLRCMQCQKKRHETQGDVCAILGGVSIRHMWAGVL